MLLLQIDLVDIWRYSYRGLIVYKCGLSAVYGALNAQLIGLW